MERTKSETSGTRTYARQARAGAIGELRVYFTHVAKKRIFRIDGVEREMSYSIGSGVHDVGYVLHPTEDGADIVVDLYSEREVSFRLRDRQAEHHGIAMLEKRVRVERIAVDEVLFGAAKWKWHLQRKNTDSSSTASLVTIELISIGLKPGRVRMIYPEGERRNMNIAGIADFEVRREDLYGIKLTSRVNRPLHVRMFYFDTSDFSISDMFGHQVGNDPVIGSQGTFIIGDSAKGGTPLQFMLHPNENLDLGYMKVFWSTEPLELKELEQKPGFDRTLRKWSRLRGANRDIDQSIEWGTALLTLVQRSPGAGIVLDHTPNKFPIRNVWLKRHRLLKLKTSRNAEIQTEVPYEGVRGYKEHSSRPRGGSVFDQMATDKPGHELSQNAAIWDIYMDEAEDYDHKLVKDRQDSLDNLLIFAGLFSAIQTAFLVESKNLLQQDPTDSSVSLLLFIAQSQQRMELGLPSPPGMIAPLSAPTFQPLSTAQWVNGIWFCSLGLSLSAALIAMLGKEWLSSYLYSRPGGGHEYALDRQARLEGLRHWWALHIIALLPSLLHLSLLVFAVGLVLYLSNLNKDIALVFAIGVAAVLVLYLSTVVLGAVVPHCPFVTQASIYLKRVLHSCQNCVRRAKTQSTEKSVPNTAHKDVQALIWLASYSKDPEVVSCCHQAMAGLRQLLKPVSPTNPTGTTDPPRDSTDPPKQLPTKLYKKTTSDMFLSTVTQRFQTLLEGTLEFANPEVVVRYVIAIIAIRASMPSVPSMPIMQPSRITWLKLLELIDKIGFSRLSSGSISPTIFANLLIAEMEVINFALDAKNDEIRRQTQGDSYLDFTDASNSHRIVTIHERTNEWLQLVSMVLAHHSSGRILLDYDVLIRLFDSMEQATKPISMAMEHPDFEPLTQPVKFFIPFAEGNPVAYHSDDLLMSPLGGIVGILSMPMAAGDDLWYKLRRSALAAYRSLAPIVFHRVFQLDLSTEAPMEDLRKPPNNDTIAYHTVYCMMSAVNIFIKNQPQQQRLRREGRLIPMLDATLALVSHCLDTDQDSESPNVQPPDALRKHFSTLNDLHKALPTYGGLQTIPRLLESTIKIMTSALRNNISGQYPPSVLNLLQMVADCPNVSNCVEMLEAIDTFLGLNAEGEIADEESAYKKREGSDFITVCIDEFTSDPQGFPILVVVAANMECRNQTWAIFVKIVSFAADYRKLEYSAGRSATSAFLDGVKSVIGSQPDTSSSETEFLFPEFFIGAAKIMYLAGLEDSVSRQLITRHPAYQNVLSQLKQRWIWDQLDHDQEGVVKQLEDLRMPDDRGAKSSSSSPKVPVEPEVFVEHKGDPTPSGSGEN